MRAIDPDGGVVFEWLDPTPSPEDLTPYGCILRLVSQAEVDTEIAELQMLFGLLVICRWHPAQWIPVRAGRIVSIEWKVYWLEMWQEPVDTVDN